MNLLCSKALPIALLLPSCINAFPLTLPTTSSLHNTRNASPNALLFNSSSAQEPRTPPTEPFYFDNHAGWAAKYTTWENPEHDYDQVYNVLNQALGRLDGERGHQAWSTSRPQRYFRYNNLAISLCFEVERVESPEPALTFEGIRVAILGAEKLASEFGAHVKGFRLEIRRESFDGPLVATGFLGQSRIGSVDSGGSLLVGILGGSSSPFNVSRRGI